MANRGRYAADMNLARRALDDGLIYQVREQLKAYRTGPRALGDLRGFEWYYLANLCDRTPIRLLGHEKAVICVAFHPDGNRVVSGGADGTVRVWDLTGRRASRLPGHGRCGPLRGRQPGWPLAGRWRCGRRSPALGARDGPGTSPGRA